MRGAISFSDLTLHIRSPLGAMATQVGSSTRTSRQAAAGELVREAKKRVPVIGRWTEFRASHPPPPPVELGLKKGK